VTISAPPPSASSVQATAGVVTIVAGVITAISINNPGSGYLTTPTVIISGGGGSNATATANVTQTNLINAVSVFRTFTITINRAFNEPYQSLYIKCMPPVADRDLISSLIQNQDITIKILGDNGSSYLYNLSKNGKGYDLNAGRLGPGIYAYEASVINNTSFPIKKGKFIVQALQTELVQTKAEHGMLNTLAIETGGSMFFPSELNKLKKALQENAKNNAKICDRKIPCNH
jgi:hypothetical protein